MDDQYSQGSLADFDVVRSTQFVDDLARSVCVSCTLHLEVTNSYASHNGNMKNMSVSTLVCAVSCYIATFCNLIE